MSPSTLAAPAHRPLGDLETLFAWGSGRYGAFTMVSPLLCEGKLNVPRLQRAARRLAERWPILAVGIAAAPNGRLILTPLPDVALDLRIVPRSGEDSWRSVAESLLNEPFPPPGRSDDLSAMRPLWSLTVLAGVNRSELVLRIHHAIFDGMGIAPFFRALLETYADLEWSSEAGPKPQTIAPPLETFLPAGARAMATLRFIGAEAKHMGRTPSPVAAPPGCVQRTVVRFGSLTVEETDAAMRAAKANGMTLNTALCAAALESVFEALPDRGQIGLQTLIDLRRRRVLPVAAEQLGLYVYWIKTWHARRRGAFSDLAREYHGALTGAIARNGVPPWGLSSMARAFLRGQVDRNPLTCTSDSVVSNMGVLPLAERYGGIRPTGLFITSCQHPLGTRFGWLVGTLHGRLRIAAHVRDPLDPPETAERMLESIRHHLIEGLQISVRTGSRRRAA